MNPIEKILISFLVNEIKNNPTFIVNIINHILEQKKVNPDLEKAVDDLVNAVVPSLINLIKV